ncbi:MAG: LL-diaminopimelate aminotransferase [Candidatus Scalindua rubra]|uniref:LL-diaminopimelate aminotransferase n=1 Tax=Candidatus Scalindua brodae TaxID=237368 RepID=A0A0B0EQS1_9BACT|nr:MAG: aminotransferase [Candidatus Scalindua brodae]MBZ0107596.1 LL-diaminopimelate aminotransferase [Candidatus Scalindua rubra]
MVKRNENIAKLQAGYLFPEIGRRKRALLEKEPDAKLISLGIGNTTEPLSPHIVEGLQKEVTNLATLEGYTGYDDDPRAQEFLDKLKNRISKNWYNGIISPDEIIVSDGSKPDCGRLFFLFGSNVSVAVQDPAYPVYVDGSVMIGATGNYNSDTEEFDGIEYMRCTAENDFFPDLSKVKRTDLIYICSPNNPTGAVATKEELKELVHFARKNKSIIIFDAAYSEFIKEEGLPRSIFEIEGARECAIEVSSLSKSAGFTGVRLGWTIVPKELKFDDGESVGKDWQRVVGTLFNGSSNIAQWGAIAALSDTGLSEVKEKVNYYMANAKIIKDGLEGLGIKTFGGVNSPYIWAAFPGKKSWDVFEDILTKAHVVTTPGAGFGKAGEGFVRFSAFGNTSDIKEAVKRLQDNLEHFNS